MSDSRLVVDSPTSWSPRDGAALLSVTLLAIVCWSSGLTDGYWIDEVISRETAAESWTSLLGRAGFGDVHPPLYYGLLKIWSGLAGSSDLMGRALSFLFALGAAALMYLQGRRRGGVLTGALASGLLVVYPLTAHYAVEVRSYALLLLLSIGSALATERWMERPGSGRRLLSCATLYSLLVLTHYFGWIWVLLLALYSGFAGSRDRGAMQRWLLLQLSVLSAAGLWLPLVLVQARHLPPEVTAHLSSSLPLMELIGLFGPGAGHPLVAISVGAGCLSLGLAAWAVKTTIVEVSPEPEDGEVPPPHPRIFIAPIMTAILTPLVSFALMPMSELLMDLYLEELPTAYALMAFAAVTALGFSRLLVRVPRFASGHLEVSLLVGGGVILGVISLFRPVLTPRNLILFLPPLVMLVSISISRQPGRLRLLWLTLFMTAAALTLPGNAERFEPRPDLRGAAERLESSAGPAVVWPRWDAPGIGHYARETPSGVLQSVDLPQPAGDTYDVVLTRQSASDPERFLSAVSSHLGPRFSRDQRWNGRGVVWCRWRRSPAP